MKLASSKPRVIMLSQFYDPEPAYKGQIFAEEIAELGYNVEVVTGFPNYPGGIVYTGFRIRPINRSRVNGIDITRLPLYPSHNGSSLNRALNYISFAASACLYLTFFARRADLVYVYHPPLTVGLAAVTAQLFRRAPVILDIHDLWPDTLPATGMLTNRRLLRIVDRACNWLYRRATRIVLHSEGFRQQLILRGVPAGKMKSVLGWAHEVGFMDQIINAPVAMADGYGFKLLYAGNVGKAQALGTVIEAAKLLREKGLEKSVTFYILGSGAMLDELNTRADDLGLKNVRFLPRVPLSEVGPFLASADALLVHLRDDPLFTITIPSKTQSYMMAGKPIIMAVRGEAATLVEKAGAGVAIAPEDPGALAAAALELASRAKEDLAAIGSAGRSYYWRELCMKKGMKKFAKLFAEARRA